MHTFLVPRRKHAPVLVVCGGCAESVRLHDAKRIKVPEGGKFVFSVDARKRTPTGGKLGAPGSGTKRVIGQKLITAWGCVACQLVFKVVEEKF